MHLCNEKPCPISDEECLRILEQGTKIKYSKRDDRIFFRSSDGLFKELKIDDREAMAKYPQLFILGVIISLLVYVCAYYFIVFIMWL